MQFTRVRIAPRIVNKQNRVEGILMYDIDNIYPQRVTDIVNASGAAKYCIKLYSKFIEGNGFADANFYQAVVNSKGLKLDKLLRAVAKDYANRYGFAIHVNYNGLFKVCDVRAVPFHYCRLIHPDNTDFLGKVVVYNNWDRRIKRNIYKSDFKYYDMFDPNPAVVEAQVIAAGGFDKYQGQILWYSEAGEDYPLAPIDAVLEDAETDGRIKSHKRKKSANGWNADFAFVVGEFESDGERMDFKDEMSTFQGDEGDGDIPLFEIQKKEQTPVILPFPKVSNDKDFYMLNETSVQTNIRKHFGFPPVLVGDYIAGKLGMAQEILDACGFVNGLTNQERRIMEESFQSIFSNWYDPAINPTNNYSVIPLTIITSEASKEVSVGTEVETSIPGAPAS